MDTGRLNAFLEKVLMFKKELSELKHVKPFFFQFDFFIILFVLKYW